MSGFALVRQASSLMPGADGTLTMSGLPAAIDAAGVRLTPHGGNARDGTASISPSAISPNSCAARWASRSTSPTPPATSFAASAARWSPPATAWPCKAGTVSWCCATMTASRWPRCCDDAHMRNRRCASVWPAHAARAITCSTTRPDYSGSFSDDRGMLGSSPRFLFNTMIFM